MMGRFKGCAPSGRMKSWGNGRPCDWFGLPSLRGAEPPPPDWNLRRFSSRPGPLKPIPLPPWFLLRFLTGLPSSPPFSSSSSDGGGVGGTSQSAVGGATHLFLCLSNTSMAGHLCRRGYPPWHAQYRLQLFPSGTLPFASSLHNGCFWHPATFCGQSHAWVSSLYRRPPMQNCSVAVPFQQVQYLVQDVSCPNIP